MRYTDRVYGSVEFTEPVLLELIQDPALQRLKGIDQAGYRPLWIYPDADITDEEFSRFAHSVGVCILLRIYDASLEEQIAGLLHDVSHSAFSHCIDYALRNGSGATQKHQDEYFHQYISQTNIPAILTKHGYDPSEILDDSRFPLLERQLPDLCADRIDYAVRNAEAFEKKWTPIKIRRLLNSLATQDGKWFFHDIAAAREFSQLFHHLNNTYFASFLGAVMLQTVGDYLAYALDKTYITYHDLYTTDRAVLKKLHPFHEADATLKTLYHRMHARDQVINSPDEYDRAVICKSRVVDPFVTVNGTSIRLSETDVQWKQIVSTERAPKRYFLKFLGNLATA